MLAATNSNPGESPDRRTKHQPKYRPRREHVIMAIGQLAKLGDGLGQVAALGGLPHSCAMKGAVEQLVRGAHSSAYRTNV